MESAPARTQPSPALSNRLALMLSAVGGLITANLYYAQPLVGLIGASLGLSVASTGLVVTLTQLGYGIGLLLIVPLGDLFENRRLILALLACCVLSLFAAAASDSPGVFLAASVGIGLFSVVMQVLLPYASHLAAETMRGRIVGLVTSGQMFGIMLARPVASLVAWRASWHSVFALSGVCLLLAWLLFVRALPRRTPVSSTGYRSLLASMVHLACTTPVLQRRAFYHAALFAAFCLFWTTVPLLLTGPHYQLSQIGVACFALVGAASVVAAPIAGRLADRGWTRAATGSAIALVVLCYVLASLDARGSAMGLILLAIAGALLGTGVTMNVVLGQRAIFLLGAEYRSRLNGLYMAAFYLSGALGSAIGSWAYGHGGWPLASALGLAMPLLALSGFATEFRMPDVFGNKPDLDH